MAETVVIQFLADTSGLQESITALDKLAATDSNLGAEFKKNTSAFSDRQKALDQQSKSGATAKLTLDQLSDSVKKLNQNVIGNASTKQVEQFATQLGTATKSSTTLVTQLRALKQELSAMESAGQSSSKAFLDLSIKAGKLQNALGDTQQRIRTLASDTKNLDAALSLATGVAGAFSVAQGAAALFGDENKDLQKALLKVQAALAILNGLQAIAATLNKDSAASVVLLGNAQEGAAAKTGLYGIALRVVSAIQTQFGISSAAAWAIATAGISLLIAGVILLVNSMKSNTVATEAQTFAQAKLNHELAETVKRNKELTDQAFAAIADYFKRNLEAEETAIQLAKIRGDSAQKVFDLEVTLLNHKLQILELSGQKETATYASVLNEKAILLENFNQLLFTEEKDALLKRLKFQQDQIPSNIEDDPEIKQLRVKQRTIKEITDEIDKINADSTKKKLEEDLQYLQAYSAIVDTLLQFSINSNNNELESLRDKHDKGLISEKSYRRQVAQFERKQAIAEKEKAVFDIAIATAVALVKAFPNAALMIAAGALGALEIAGVASRPIPEIPQFAKGKEKVTGGTPGKDSVLAMLMPGERVVPANINAMLGDIPNADLPKLMGVYPDLPYISNSSMDAMEKYRSTGTQINYDLLADKLSKKLGDEIAKHPRLNVTLDQHGFTKSIIEGINKQKSLDDYYSSNR